MTFQQMIAQLLDYWTRLGCVQHQGIDIEVGAGTLNPATFLRCLGPEPYKTVYVEPSRRPGDGRYGENPNRVQLFHQLQVILKPSPLNLQELYLKSLSAVGLNLDEHDIRFVHDDWENPTIGAWGLGWEVWSDGMEISQFTYFQAVGGINVFPVSGELTIGLERLAMYIQGVESIYDLKWNDELTYGEVCQRNEWEFSHYNFHEATVAMWHTHFEDFEREARHLIQKDLPLPAYECVMKCSHAFNILDARGAISVTERARYIGRIRALAKVVAQSYVHTREKQSFPLLKKEKPRSDEVPPLGRGSLATEREDFLLEIGSEELPATFVPIGMRHLKRDLQQLLDEHGLSYKSIEVFGTPRRLALLVKQLRGGTPSTSEKKRGPKVAIALDREGRLTKAGEGFIRSCNSSKEALMIEGDYVFAMKEIEGISTTRLLSQKLSALILGLDFPKKMKWSDLPIEYARPLSWIVALYGKEVIPCSVGPYLSSNQSRGHRQLADKPCTIAHPSDYIETMRKMHVMVDPQERERTIASFFENDVVQQERVMREVVHMVEYPFPLRGSFDPCYLEAPQEVLISAMIEHQRYFPLIEKGKLIPEFVVVSNNTPSQLIEHGHERALSPRLADGVFLYEEDLKIPLESFNERLAKMTDQEELGSMLDHVDRLKQYVTLLHRHIPIGSLEKTLRATHLCKADLATGLVGEFPDLQGVVGKIYALKHGEEPSVALPIDEHWMPRGEKGTLPTTEEGVLLSLAEKFDNLIACFALGRKPTSSADPFALRRQAVGVLRILIEKRCHLNLELSLKEGLEVLMGHPKLSSSARKKMDKEVILQDLATFIKGRLRSLFVEMGYAKDAIEAVLDKPLLSPYDLYCRLEMLTQFRKSQDFTSLFELYHRIRKILVGQKEAMILHPELLKAPEEQALFDKLYLVKEKIFKDFIDRCDFKRRDYHAALSALSHLQPEVRAFFDTVKVMDTDPKIKANRLALLNTIWELCEEYINLNRLQGL